MTEEHKEKCTDCGEIHEEIKDPREIAGHIASSFTEECFSDFWEEMRGELKQLSKKELAQEVFFQAVSGFITASLAQREEEENRVRESLIH